MSVEIDLQPARCAPRVRQARAVRDAPLWPPRTGAALPPVAGVADGRATAIAAFYRANSASLRWRVGRRVQAPSATVEDACQVAWATLLRRSDIDLNSGGLKWLTTVAIHEAWRQTADAREIPAGVFLSPPANESPERSIELEPVAETADPAERVIALQAHRQRVEDLRALRPRERRELYLHGAGYTYRDIAVLTVSSYTAVNRRVSEGRARLRELERDRQTRRPG